MTNTTRNVYDRWTAGLSLLFWPKRFAFARARMKRPGFLNGGGFMPRKEKL